MKVIAVASSLLFLATSVTADWCTSYGISTRFDCGAGRWQFCCDNRSSGDMNIFRGDCTRPEGNTRNCGDNGFVSCCR
ncbi:hypothetical protein B0T11DRAFT_333552 [Plectosphaerella cucumerina]|uniref:Uncharacterized protein n=1 Tax=Plectosphaerella cucumerina TaxID=40658 RepID=A0A8K0T4D6_9PEZI|nr:hypothetical protein B0T11DRAFT_333552 [Plectosphaerella cucumerina]